MGLRELLRMWWLYWRVGWRRAVFTAMANSSLGLRIELDAAFGYTMYGYWLFNNEDRTASVMDAHVRPATRSCSASKLTRYHS